MLWAGSTCSPISALIVARAGGRRDDMARDRSPARLFVIRLGAERYPIGTRSPVLRPKQTWVAQVCLSVLPGWVLETGTRGIYLPLRNPRI